MDSIKGTISSVSGATSTQVDDTSTKSQQEPTTSTMDSIKETISSYTGGAGSSTQTADDNSGNTGFKPAPPETGLQSRGQTEHSGNDSFLGQMKDMVNSAVGGGGTKAEKEVALDQGQGQQRHDSAVAEAKPEQIEEFIRNSYHSQGSGKLQP